MIGITALERREKEITCAGFGWWWGLEDGWGYWDFGETGAVFGGLKRGGGGGGADVWTRKARQDVNEKACHDRSSERVAELEALRMEQTVACAWPVEPSKRS